jgi:lysophospholipase L1-like esterase
MPQHRRYPAIAASIDASPLRIAGFGACMIAGYPYENEGFFEVACGIVEKSLSRSVKSQIVSLGGFPAPRAAKHLEPRVFKFNPDYVVIQFGATDAQCPIRAKNRPAGSKSKSIVGYHVPTALTAARWEMASLIGFLRKAAPITPLSLYIKAIERMADDCISAGIRPIVLSPFVFGSRYSTKNAILYTKALHELHLSEQDFILIDCIQLMSKFPRSMMLLHDGFHISGAAHKLIGEAIGTAIVADVARVDPPRIKRDHAG